MEQTIDEAILLTALDRAEQGKFQTDLKTLQENADWYWLFPEKPCAVISGLRTKGLIEGAQPAMRLTESGRTIARSSRAQRPDLCRHFYRKFYPAARASLAHSRFCKRVFGADLCQDGQVDMAAAYHGK